MFKNFMMTITLIVMVLSSPSLLMAGGCELRLNDLYTSQEVIKNALVDKYIEDIGSLNAHNDRLYTPRDNFISGSFRIDDEFTTVVWAGNYVVESGVKLSNSLHSEVRNQVNRILTKKFVDFNLVDFSKNLLQNQASITGAVFKEGKLQGGKVYINEFHILAIVFDGEAL